jgi:hypothetical protein
MAGDTIRIQKAESGHVPAKRKHPQKGSCPKPSRLSSEICHPELHPIVAKPGMMKGLPLANASMVA